MKAYILPLISIVLAVAVAAGVAVSFTKHNGVDHTIVDISWPNCGSAQPPQSVWGVVGVTGGLDFRPNPCLAQEASWFRHLSLYVNTGYPGISYAEKYRSFPNNCSRSDSQCLAYNYGYNATLYAINYANREGAHTNLWWFDVETDNSWSDDVSANQASLEGAVAAVKKYTFMPTIGFYSDIEQWYLITGGWSNHLPTWIGTGDTTVAAAASSCGSQSFTGGPLWLSQYTEGLDKNYPCTAGFMSSLSKLGTY